MDEWKDLEYRFYIKELYKDRSSIAFANGQRAVLMIFRNDEEMMKEFDKCLKNISRKQQTLSIQEMANVAITELRDYFKSDYMADTEIFVMDYGREKGRTKQFLKALENVLLTKLRNGRTQNLFEVYIDSKLFSIDYAIMDFH